MLLCLFIILRKHIIILRSYFCVTIRLTGVNMKLGKLIVIEGASDGIGKSTQIEKLKEHLIADGAKISTHHFPTYYSYQGKGVEQYLSGQFGQTEELSPYFINNLYAYDRAITWRIKLKDLYRKGHTILLDRYTTSSLIYQSAPIKDKSERREFINFMIDFEYNKLGIQQPDAVIFLHAPLELVHKLRQARLTNEGDIENDIHEHNYDFLQKVYNNSMEVAKYLGWTMINCATKDGRRMRSVDSIHREIYEKLSAVNDKTP